MNKRNLILYLSLIIIIVSVAFTISYAYLKANVTGNDPATFTNVSSGKLDITFATSAYINNNNLLLISDSDVATKADQTSFTIDNTKSNISGIYKLSLTELSISNNLKSNDFKWELLKNDTIINSGNFSTAVTGTDFILTSSNQTITPGTTDSYKLRIWLSETTSDQISLTNGSFSAKVKMTAIQG